MESVLEPRAFLKEFKIVSSSFLKLSYYSGKNVKVVVVSSQNLDR